MDTLLTQMCWLQELVIWHFGYCMNVLINYNNVFYLLTAHLPHNIHLLLNVVQLTAELKRLLVAKVTPRSAA